MDLVMELARVAKGMEKKRRRIGRIGRQVKGMASRLFKGDERWTRRGDINGVFEWNTNHN